MEQVYAIIIERFNEAENFTEIMINIDDKIIRFYKCESGISGSTLINIGDIKIKYLCIIFRHDKSYRCADYSKCSICSNKVLDLSDCLRTTFNGSSISPDFLFRIKLPINIEVILDVNKKVKYGNVHRIDRVCGGHGKVQFTADVVDGAGETDMWSNKSAVKHAIFYGCFPYGSYCPEEVTIIKPKCKVNIIN